MLEAYVTLSANERAQACLGQSHLLVGRSEQRALTIEDRIDQVGVSQRLFQRLGHSRTARCGND
jgi:hypothetical protein